MVVRKLNYPSDELYHHGVKGQKWGVRRYQRLDGSLTMEGYRHYGFDSSGRRGIVRTRNAIAKSDATAAYYANEARVANEIRNRRIQKGKDTTKIDKKISEYSEIAKQARKDSKALNKFQKDNLKRASKFYDIKMKDIDYPVYVNKGKTALGSIGAVAMAMTVSAVTGSVGFGLNPYGPTVVSAKNYKFKKKAKDKETYTEYNNYIKITNGKKTSYQDKHTGESLTKSQALKRESQGNKYSNMNVPVKKKSQPSASKGLSWDDSYKVTKVSDVPKSAKLQFDKHDGITEVSWLTNDGHIAFGEYDPKTKKIFDVNING